MYPRFLSVLVAVAAILGVADARLRMDPGAAPQRLIPPTRRHAGLRVCSRSPHVQVGCAPGGAHANYYGGPVISNVKVVMVFYGAGTYQPYIANDTPPSMESFLEQVVDSPYLDWLAEYNTPTQTIGRGTYAGEFSIQPSPGRDGATIDDVDIQAELAAQLQTSSLPAPDANTLYVIFFPQGKSITLQGSGSSCSDGGFCAYHSTTIYNNADVEYAVIPDNSPNSGCDVGCGGGTLFENEQATVSHELVESITDPAVGLTQNVGFPLAWYDPVNGELADICNDCTGTFQGSDGFTYTVEDIYSDTLSACVSSAAPLISDIQASNVTSSGAQISWNTDYAATSTVNYGPNTGYGSSVSDASPTTNHTLLLTGLSPGTTYHFRVSSSADSFTAASTDQTVVTVSGGVLQFTAALYSGNESGGSIQITVSRTGDTSGAASVNVVTADGTAVSGTDFTGGNFPVLFPAGSTSQSLQITVSDDNLIEPTESFTVSLSNPVGASLGTLASAQVSILDDTARTTPSNLRAFAVGPSQILLTWTNNAANQSSFQIQRKSFNGIFAPDGTSPGTQTSFLDSSVPSANAAFTYEVLAATANGQSNYSSPVTVTIPTGGKLAVSTKKLSFGKVKAAKPKTLSFTVSNSGKGTLSGNVGTPGSPYSVVSGGGPFTIAEHGKPLKISVEFAPTSALSGTASLPITSTDPAHPSEPVTLSGMFNP